MEILDIEEVQSAPSSTELAPIERAELAMESSKTVAYLREKVAKFASITVAKDKATRDQAHNGAMELMRDRTTIEKRSKEVRDDAVKFSKATITVEGQLVGIIKPEEARLKGIRDDWDNEQARIKAEAEAIERARVLAISDRIVAIKNYVVLANNCRTSERVAELMTKLAAIELDDSFAEFIDEAKFAHSYTTSHLKLVHTNKVEEEAAAAAEKAEQERIKAEQLAEAARLKAEREEFARQQAEAAAALKKQQDELDAQRAAAAAEAQRVAHEARVKTALAEAKVRAAAEELAQQRDEFERQKAEETLAKAAEAAEAFALPTGIFSEMTLAEVDARITSGEPPVFVVLPPEPAFDELVKPVDVPPRAPVASAIVLAVAEFFGTDNKTAARWITERAAEIETLKD